MKRNRDFHKQVRVVYRSCRRLYGIEKTQDECLKVFKIVFPELYRARQAEETNMHLSEDGIRSLDAVFVSWNRQENGELLKLCDLVIGEAGRWRFKDDFIKFCEDIMPVVMRIRKLTPCECFRLMGVSEKDIDTLLDSGLSNSACINLQAIASW